MQPMLSRIVKLLNNEETMQPLEHCSASGLFSVSLDVGRRGDDAWILIGERDRLTIL